MVSDDPALSYWWDGIFARIANDPDLSPVQHRVLDNVLHHVQKNHSPTRQTIANGTGLGLRTVGRWLAWLKTNNYLLIAKQANAKGWRIESAYAVGPKCHIQKATSKGPPVAQQREKLISSVLKSVDQVQSYATEETDERTAPRLVREVSEEVPRQHPHPVHGDVGLGPREVPLSSDLNHPPPTLACPDEQEQSQVPSPPPERAAMSADRAIDRVLDKLERVRRNGASHLASCPVISHGKGNGDREPSLSIGENDGRVLLNCMSGCHTQDVLAAMDLDWPDLFDEPITNERGVKVAEWVYQARDGSPWLTVERWQTPAGKRFVQRVPGAKEAGLPKDFRPALFKLPKVLAAAKAGEEVFVVEGEKCVSAAERLGITATTAPAGVNGWRDYYSDWLKGASRVTIICDNDEPGMRYASAVAASLKGKEIPVRTVKVAVATPKADIYDHVMAGYGLSDLVPVKLNQFRPDGTEGDKLALEVFPPVEWVIKDLMPVGFTVLGGAPKVGKSFVALDAAMNVSLGGEFLHTQDCVRGSVLYLSLDNDAMWRLQLRLRHLAIQYGVSPGIPDIEFHTDFPTGEAAIKGIAEWCADQREIGKKPLMVVADTIAKVEPNFDGSSDRNSMNGGYGQATSNLSKWSQLALDQRIGILATHHVRKSGDDDWMNRYIGSQGIAATATTLMMIDTQRGTNTGNLLVSSRDAGDHKLEMERAGWSWHLKEQARGEQIVTTGAGLRVLPGGKQ